MSPITKITILLKIIGAWIAPSQADEDTRAAARIFALFVLVIALGFTGWGAWLSIETAQARAGRVNLELDALATTVPATSLTADSFRNYSRVRISGTAQLAHAAVVLFDDIPENRYVNDKFMMPLTDADWAPGDPVETMLVFQDTSIDPLMIKFPSTSIELEMVAALQIPPEDFRKWSIRDVAALPTPTTPMMQVEDAAARDTKQNFQRWFGKFLAPVRTAGFNVDANTQFVELINLSWYDEQIWLRRLHNRFGFDAFNLFAISLFIAVLMLVCWRRVREPKAH